MCIVSHKDKNFILIMRYCLRLNEGYSQDITFKYHSLDRGKTAIKNVGWMLGLLFVLVMNTSDHLTCKTLIIQVVILIKT